METSMYEIIVNSLSANVAVLDEKGVIVKTNRAWQAYALQNGLEGKVDSVGVNYLGICELASADGEREGELVAIGIGKYCQGSFWNMSFSIPATHPPEDNGLTSACSLISPNLNIGFLWFMRMLPPLFIAQEEVEQKTEELRRKSEKLEEMNVALNVLLETPGTRA